MNDILAIIQRITALEREVARLASIEDPKVTLASYDHRPLRVGSDVSDWSLSGLTTYIPDTMLVTVGSSSVTTSGFFVSFPDTYSGKPLVFTQAGNPMTSVETTVSGFYATVYDTSFNVTSGILSWFALGPVDE